MSPAVTSMEVVERPLSSRGKWNMDEEIRALMETAESGQAVRLDVGDQAGVHKVHMALRHATMRRGFKFSYKKVGPRTLLAWVDKRR